MWVKMPHTSVKMTFLYSWWPKLRNKVSLAMVMDILFFSQILPITIMTSHFRRLLRNFPKVAPRATKLKMSLLPPRTKIHHKSSYDITFPGSLLGRCSGYRTICRLHKNFFVVHSFKKSPLKVWLHFIPN